MIRGGFAGSVLHVDLSSGHVASRPLEEAWAEDFLGGLGINVKLAHDHVAPGVDPFSPENVVVLGVGPLVGTSLPGTSRVFAMTRLPQTGSVGWAGAGGVVLGSALKYAGYDHLVLSGAAERPVYLEVVDDSVRIRDARALWGLGVKETAKALAKAVGMPAGTVCIGPGGEHRVSFAMAFVDGFSTLGRGGLGAVLGAKRLKGIVVKGTGAVGVADRKRYRTLAAALLRRVRDYPHLKEWQELGLVRSLPFVPRDLYRSIRKRRVACTSCPIGDKDVIEIPDGEGGTLVVCSSSAVNLFMPVVYGFQDTREAIRVSALIDDAGLDMFELFGVLQHARVLQERGALPADRLEEPVVPDSPGSVERWTRRISRREGFGAVLADGIPGLLRACGEEAGVERPPLIKGMLPYVGPKGPLPWHLFGTMELGQALDPRGPHVGSSGSPTYFGKRPLEAFPGHLERMGVPADAMGRILPGRGPDGVGDDLRVGRLLAHAHNWFCTLGSLGVCARAQVNRFYSAALCADLYEAVTGIPTPLEELRRRADRIWTLLRMANVRQGLDRRADAVPRNWHTDMRFNEYVTEAPMTAEAFERMIDDYYEERGWDVRTGVPTAKKLASLGLAE